MIKSPKRLLFSSLSQWETAFLSSNQNTFFTIGVGCLRGLYSLGSILQQLPPTGEFHAFSFYIFFLCFFELHHFEFC